MMAGLNGWWRQRTLREQRLIAVAGLLFSGMVLSLGIVRPLGIALADARERHAGAVLALADARADAETIRTLQRGVPPVQAAPLQELLGQAAAEAGFTVARIEPQGARQANVAIDAVRPQALLAWVGDLERRRGLVVDRLSARANSDATVAVEVSFRVRSR